LWLQIKTLKTFFQIIFNVFRGHVIIEHNLICTKEVCAFPKAKILASFYFIFLIFFIKKNPVIPYHKKKKKIKKKKISDKFFHSIIPLEWGWV